MNLLETKTANINNQTVFKEIDDFMMEMFATVNIHWLNGDHRTEFVEMMDMWFEQYALESGKIIQYDIQCDARNNSKGDDNIYLTLKYRQKNCLNTSSVSYIFEP